MHPSLFRPREQDPRQLSDPNRSRFDRRRFLYGIPLFLMGACRRQPTEKITVAAGSLAGAWSAISEGLVSCIRRGLPEAAVTSEPGLDGANAALVDTGRVQLGLVHSTMARLALQGEYPYSRPLKNVQAVSLVYADSAQHFLVSRKTGLSSIDQIREQRYPLRLSVIYRGSLMEIASRTLLDEYGISYADIESWGGKVYFRALRPSLELMQDGRLDAVSLTVQYPQSQIRQASLDQDLTLLPLSPEVVKAVNARLGTYASHIPATAYDFLSGDVTTMSDIVVLIANAALSDSYAYAVTRAICQDLDYLHTVHRALAKLRLEQLAQVGSIPLHPGARRYYLEAGIL